MAACRQPAVAVSTSLTRSRALGGDRRKQLPTDSATLLLGSRQLAVNGGPLRLVDHAELLRTHNHHLPPSAQTVTL